MLKQEAQRNCASSEIVQYNNKLQMGCLGQKVAYFATKHWENISISAAHRKWKNFLILNRR